MSELTADKTFYVRTDGNDSNNGLTTGNAFLTPSRAVEESKKYFIGGHLLSIDVGAGIFNCSISLDPGNNEGANITWTGVATEYTNRTINLIDVAPTALPDPRLEYIDFKVWLPAHSAAEGQFVLIKATSGGTNPNLVKGCHEIVAWNAMSGSATVRCVRVPGITKMPSGTITATALTLVRTVLNFSTDRGIDSVGSRHCGTWDSMVFKGVFSQVAVKVRQGATISLGSNFGTSKWGVNLSCHTGATIHANSSVHSYSDIYLVSASTDAFVSLRDDAILSGGRISAIRSFERALVDFASGQVMCCGGGAYTRIIQCYGGGFVNALGVNIEGSPPSVSTAFHVTSGGGIDSSGSTDDAATARGQEGSPGGNGSYHVY